MPPKPKVQNYTKEEMAVYNKRFRRGRGVLKSILLPPLNYTPDYPKLTLPALNGEIVYCRDFKCGRILNLQERLYGNYCILHQGHKLVGKGNIHQQ